MSKHLTEKDLYPSIVKYFEEQGATFTKTEPNIVLKTTDGYRYPDVAAIMNHSDGSCDVHLAEGKLSASGKPWGDCKSQAHSLQTYGEYVYLFCPSDKWERLSKLDREEKEQYCREHGFGILLVNLDKYCRKILEPRRQNANFKKKQEIRDQLNANYFPLLEPAGFQESKIISKIIRNFYDLMSNEIWESFENANLKASTDSKEGWADIDYDFEIDYFWIYISDKNKRISVDADILGWLKGDGVPTIYVVVNLPFDKFIKYFNKDNIFGSVFYVQMFNENEEIEFFEKGLTIDWNKQEIERLNKIISQKDNYKNAELYLYKEVDTLKRLRSNIEQEVTQYLKEAKNYIKVVQKGG